MYDLAQPLFGAVMLAGAGSPITFQPVETNLQEFTDWMVKAYEEELGSKIDRDELQRMLNLRQSFYFEFCTHALEELKDAPPQLDHMKKFIGFVVSWAERVGYKKSN
jgi:hypothetical protein